MAPEHDVAHYYDRNTGRFLRFGGARDSYAIHRALWGPGVTTDREAGNFINRWLAEAIRELGIPEPGSLVDLGCGVGGTLFHLAESFPESRLHGVTISRRQVEVANHLRSSRKGGERCRFVHGDFHSLALGLEADVVVAVESFVHSNSPEAFLHSAEAHLRPGGLLFVVDDFLARPRNELGEVSRRRVREFEAGWRLGSLCTVEELQTAGKGSGLEAVRCSDLTHLIRPGRPRDRLIALLNPLFRRGGLVRVPFFANMIGGHALQVGLVEGFLRYCTVVLRRPA
jgi:tocopherol O-methyltransferase